jgi:hypothetical protein
MSDLELTMMKRVGELKADLRNCYTAIRVKDEENARLKAEVERLRKAGEWQPIETAPKDMTRVLGYVEEYIVVMWWFTYSNGRSCWETVDGESEVDPTHWMPLPKPPQEGKPSV